MDSRDRMAKKTDIISNQKGASIIAVVAIMLILAVMGAALVSLVTTGSDISINQLQSEQAFSIAEGGKEYIIKNRAFPNYSTQGATIPLGGTGSIVSNFKVDTPAYLGAAIDNIVTTIPVNSTANFPVPGRIVIDSEVIAYTGTDATPSFTGATRGTGGTTAAAHASGNAVYPVTTVTPNPIAVGDLTINIASTTGFVAPGVIKIDSEYIYCASSTATTFDGCIRGYKNSTPTIHTVSSNVFQYIITSTATVGNSQRVIRIATDRIGGEEITNGEFLSDISGWTEVNTKTEGTSGWDSAAGNPAGSLISKTNGCAGTVCRGLWFQGYREQTLSTSIPSGVNVTLQLYYSKSVTGAAGGSSTDMSVVIVYQGGGTATIWSDTTEATIGFTLATPPTFVSADIITAIRLVYDLKNPNGPAGDNTQRTVWFDTVSLTTPGGPGALTWQESY